MESARRNQRRGRSATSQSTIQTAVSQRTAPSSAVGRPAPTPFTIQAGVPLIGHGLWLALAASLVAALLTAGISIVGLILGSGGLYGDPNTAIGATASTAGLLVPGVLGHDC